MKLFPLESTYFSDDLFSVDQIEKIVLFLLEQQGSLASRIEKLGKQRAILAEQPDISAIAELREAYREVGLDLIKLLKFVDLNATGIRKILKKFDKRFSYRFTDYYVSSRSNHPYSQLQQVFKHVVMYYLQNLSFIDLTSHTLHSFPFCIPFFLWFCFPIFFLAWNIHHFILRSVMQPGCRSCCRSLVT